MAATAAAAIALLLQSCLDLFRAELAWFSFNQPCQLLMLLLTWQLLPPLLLPLLQQRSCFR